MITRTEPLGDYLAQYREIGLDAGVFPTQSGDRYALRLVDPDDRKIGTTFLASFSKKVVEANRPSDPNAQIAASQKLDAMIHDDKASAHFIVCHCKIDEKSIAEFGFAEDDLDNTFLTIAYPGTAESDSYREAKAESKVKRVTKK
jgi:hypothetical protein